MRSFPVSKMPAFCSIILSLIILDNSVSAQNQPDAYQLYSTEGQKISYQQMVNTLANSDVIFFGEVHNNPICHWLQKRITRELYQQTDSLVLGAEMFEADNQLLVDEYLHGWIDNKSFEDEARLWPNYQTDYKPILEFAKSNDIHFVATNIPRRYASTVHEMGLKVLDSLTKEAKQYIAPLPIDIDMTLASYQEIKSMGHGNSTTIVQAQAVKDATMAHFILANTPDEGTFLHYNGNFHSKNREGIVWYVKQHKPSLNIQTIATVQQDTIAELDTAHTGMADYILCVPSDMTATH